MLKHAKKTYYGLNWLIAQKVLQKIFEELHRLYELALHLEGFCVPVVRVP